MACFCLLSQGLQALHDQGRGHVDIKADNVQIREWGDPSKLHATLLDLGSSLPQGAGQNPHGALPLFQLVETAAKTVHAYSVCWVPP